MKTLTRLLMFLVFMMSCDFFGFISVGHSSTNIAIGKSYTLSSPPNYPHTAPPDDRTSLTDGRYTAGHFWTQKTTVGWKSSGIIEILVDLGNAYTIGGLAFHTAGGGFAGVFFPQHIYAFVGPDLNHFLYVGDLGVKTDQEAGGYQVRTFELTDIQASGRYVLLEVVPNGFYLFCDEIEVFEGAGVGRKTGGLRMEDARKWPENPFAYELHRRLMSEYPSEAAWRKYQTQLEKRISDPSELVNVPESLETEILRVRRDMLNGKFPGKDYLVDSVDPWAPLSPVYVPSTQPLGALFLIMPQNGHAHAALVITNISADSRPFSFSLSALPSEAPDVKFHQAPFVKNSRGDFVADPLVSDTGNTVLRPGESRMVMVTASGKVPGSWKGAIRVISQKSSASVPLMVQVSSVSIPEIGTLNGNNWAYLNKISIGDRQRNAIGADLADHRINVCVVPPVDLPLLDKLKGPDFRLLEGYLRLYRGVDKVLLFMGYNLESYRTGESKFQFLSEEWKQAFRLWYAGAIAAVKKAGLTEDRVYLYPFDEVAESETGLLIALASWARQNVPGVKFFATLANLESVKALSFLDIAQLGDNESLLGSLPASERPELWLYDAKGPGKTLSPYDYYRLMPWKAFSLGFKGAGFWNYSDFGRWGKFPGRNWDEIAVQDDTYAVIYEGKNGEIVSSRRWEAWRMGVQDFELLTMYAQGGGKEKAKKYAKWVLDKPDDSTRADRIRRIILRELSEAAEKGGRIGAK